MTMVLRVLVCDDELIARRRASRLLSEQADVEIVAECASGEEVLAKLAVEDVDLVVLDINMPDIDGFDLLGRLRLQTGQTDLPAVFLSGRTQIDDIAAGRALGAAYLTKPFVSNALIGAIETQLDVQAATQGW
jgi:CheY-like chemotaxis protein